MGKQQSVSEPKEHEALVNFMSNAYYKGGEKEKLREKLTKDPVIYEKSLKLLHQDSYNKLPYEEFKQKYTAKYGNPFEEKKSPNESTEGSGTPVVQVTKPSVKPITTLPSQTSPIENRLLGNKTLQQAYEESKTPSEKAFGEFQQEKNLQNNIPREQKIRDQMLQEHPGLQSVYNSNNTNVSLANQDRLNKLKAVGGENRQMETWFPDDEGDKSLPHPTPGKFNFEYYNPKVFNNDDLLKHSMYLDALHGMKQDPKFKAMRDEFAANYKPEELKHLQEKFKTEKEPNETFDKYLDRTATDAYLRGGLNQMNDEQLKQYPDEYAQLYRGKVKENGKPLDVYSPKQKEVIGKMQSYLKAPSQKEDPNVLKQGLSPSQEAQIKARNKATADSGKEHNPFTTAYKGAADFIANQIPKMGAGAAAEIISAVPKITASGQMMALTGGNNEQTQKKLIEFTQKKEEQSQKETSNLVKSLSDIHDWKDLGNYLAYNISQAGVQIPLAVGTAGISSAIQESSNHYLEGVEEIAKRKGMTEAQVIEQNLDKPATAIATGILSGALDYVGAKNVAKAINYNNIFDTIKAKALSALKSVGTEGATEAGQSVVGQVSKNVQAEDSLPEALSKVDPKQVLEEGVAGAVGAGGLHAISSTVNKISELTTKKKKLEKDINNPEVSEEAKAAIQKEKNTTDADLDEAKKEVHDEHEKVVEGKIPAQTSPVAEVQPELKEAETGPERNNNSEKEKINSNYVAEKMISEYLNDNKIDHSVKKADRTDTRYFNINGFKLRVSDHAPSNEREQADFNINYTKHTPQELKEIVNKIAENISSGKAQDKKDKVAQENKAEKERVEKGMKEASEASRKLLEEGNKYYAPIQQRIQEKGLSEEEYLANKKNPDAQWVVNKYKPGIPVIEKDAYKIARIIHKIKSNPKTAENELGENNTTQKEEKNEQTKTILPTSEGEKIVPRETVKELENKELNKESSSKGLNENSTEETEIYKEKPQEEQPEKKERKTTKRILEGNYSEPFKKGITEEGKHYIPRSHKLSEKEADAYIEEKGHEEALHDLADQHNGMLNDNRVMLGNKLMEHYEGQAIEAENAGKQYEADRLNEKANQAEEALAKHLTASGQAVSAARKIASGSRLVMNAKKEIKTKRKDFIEKNKEQITKKVKAVNQANEEASKEAIKTKRVKEKIDKIRNVPVKVKKPVDIGKEKIVKAKKEAAAELNRLIKESLKRTSSGVDPALAGKIVTAGAKYIYHSIAEGAYNLKQLKSKLIEEFGKDIEPYADDIINSEHEGENLKKLADDFKAYDVKSDAKKAVLANLDEKLEDIVKKHYTEVDKAKRTLSDKIVKELDLPEEQAKEISKIVEEEFDRLATEKKKQALNKLKPRIIKKKEHEQLHEQIIKLSNLGALDEEAAQQLYADKFGIPELTAEQAKKIKELANRVQKAKGAEAKNKAGQDLLNYQTKIGGISAGEIINGIWYANVLSALSTQEKNALGSITQTIGETLVSAIQDRNLKATGFQLQGLFRGLSRGLLVAKDVSKTGYQPVKDLKIETSNALENSKWGIIHKYVGRVMVATDAIFYHGNKEMRAAQLAYAATKGNKQRAKTANEILYNTREHLEEAQGKATEEGLKGNQHKRRVAEIMEESRPNNITEDANNFASRATFNYEPEGVLGSISSWLNQGANKAIEQHGIKPLKYLIPFTRVIANVVNEQVNWTPWGLIRAAKGSIGLGAPESFKHKYTPEEKQRILIKGVLGTVGMAALLYFSSDEEDPLFEITANGPGDRQKNYQLMETGWRPYSIKIGDKWYDYRMTPIGLMMAMVGFINDARKYKGENDTMDKVGIAFTGTAQYVMGSTAISGLSDFFDSFSKDNPDGGKDYLEKIQKMTVRTGKTFFVPNFVQQGIKGYEEVFDMPLKKSHNILEEAVKDYPMFNDNLDNLYNALGEPVMPDQLSKFIPFSPSLKNKGEEHDKVWNLIIDNQAFVSAPSKANMIFDPNTEEDRLFTDKELNEFGRRRGQLIKEKIIENYDEIKELPKSEAQERLRDIYSEAGSEVKINFFE